MKRILAAFCASAALVTAVALAAGGRDGISIHNYGSTNFTGYTIQVWTDGTASYSYSTRIGQQIEQPQSAHIDPALVRKLIDDASAAKNGGAIGGACMKSASFGTTTVVQYHGWTSPDVECPGGGFVIALGSDAKKIVAALKIQPKNYHQIRMLPNEPRRVPSEPAPGQASATPEPNPSAS
jgi:hypothetical protein